ncbi:MAG: hypothetical protein MUF66_00830 [Gammaproteobacteria bacterium]|nr:hypothetical protein [Gammaproteobacteria bacterium]
MAYFFGGLSAATLVGLGSVMVYGPASQLQQAWVEPVFWSLIISGAVMSLFEEAVTCKLCALREWLTGSVGRCDEDACPAG